MRVGLLRGWRIVLMEDGTADDDMKKGEEQELGKRRLEIVEG